MKRLAIGLFLLSFFPGANPNGFAQTQEQLIAGAKKEGKLVVYASATAPQLQMYFAAFNKKYPFVKTEFFRTGNRSSSARYYSKSRPSNTLQTSSIPASLRPTFLTSAVL